MTLLNKKLITFAAITAFFAMGTVVYADTANVPVTVEISSPTLDLTTTPPTGIDFGAIITANAGNTVVTLDSSANVASSPVVTSGSGSINGAGNSGTITVGSNIDAIVNVVITNVQGDAGTDDVLEDFGGVNSIAFAETAVSPNTPTTLAVTAGTPATLHVGGALTVGNTQTAGTFGGTVIVDIDYP